ncbi:hypothetical protein ILUMI_11864, partial [Ignelater luminosus]
MASKPLIKESLVLLDFCGLNPRNQNTRTHLQVALTILSLFHLTVELALQLFFNWTDLESVDGITELGMIYQNESISQAVYNSDWWIKTQPEVRRACSLVIQRANKIEKLTAGGMFVLNLESFTK